MAGAKCIENYRDGLGVCWIGAFYEQHVKQILGIPADLRVVAMMPLGYHA